MTSSHMICPACQRPLSQMTIGDLTVQSCSEGCGGVWFGSQELRRFTDPGDAAGQALAAFAGEPQIQVDSNQRRRCPKCPDSVLMRHFFSAKRAVMVDECPTCAGMWLDAGELGQILSEYSSVEARRHAARASVEEILIDDRMALFEQQLQEQLPLDTSRSCLISSLLVAFYLVVAVKTAGASSALRLLLFCVTPWACVSFPEAMAALISPVLGPARESPRRFVWFFGWLVLALPVIQVAIVAFSFIIGA
jgi:uncharacterized protein